jgi:uncharacterized protein YjbJ (UPF0337 family)
MVTAQKLQGSWNRVRGQIKERWGNLTDDDLQIRNGNIDQLVGRIQQRTGEAREAIEQFLTEVTESGSSAISQAAQAVGDVAQHAGERVREHMDYMSHQAGEGYVQAQQLVKRYPAQSVAAIFGVGVGLGLLLGLTLRGR